MSEQAEQVEQVELPWLDEPVELTEAIELIAQADEDDEQTLQKLKRRVEKLERRVATLEDSSSVECPSCGSEEEVYKAGVGAAKLATKNALNKTNVDALNSASHVCLDCRESFTPTVE